MTARRLLPFTACARVRAKEECGGVVVCAARFLTFARSVAFPYLISLAANVYGVTLHRVYVTAYKIPNVLCLQRKSIPSILRPKL